MRGSPRIRYHRYFVHQLRKLPEEAKIRILAALAEYAETGRGDVRRVSGELARLRVGEYRIFFGHMGEEIRAVGVFHRRFEYARHLLLAALERLREFREPEKASNSLT